MSGGGGDRPGKPGGRQRSRRLRLGNMAESQNGKKNANSDTLEYDSHKNLYLRKTAVLERVFIVARDWNPARHARRVAAKVANSRIFPENSLRMKKPSRSGKMLKFAGRWGIAIVGLWYVLAYSPTSWHDQVLALPATGKTPVWLSLATPAAETDVQFKLAEKIIVPPSTRPTDVLDRNHVLNPPESKKIFAYLGTEKRRVLGMDLSADLKTTRRVLLANAQGDEAKWQWVDAAKVYATPDDTRLYAPVVPHPRVQVGVVHMLHDANRYYLLAALLIYPLTIFITSLRWQELLKALDVRIPVSRAFVINCVGMFYNSFMPGSSGGDVLKAYYVAKQTHHGTRAVMSVIVDRVIGLLALIILGGAMATLQWKVDICRRVAIGAGLIVALTIAGLIVFYVPLLRKLSGFNFLASKLPMQARVQNAIEAMEILGRRPLLALGALVVTFPVHITVVVSAALCGMAFGLPIGFWYYWVAIPVIVLAWAIPLSPQGAGVMEYTAFKLLEPQGATIAHVLAITMSIRLVALLWNLVGGYFVLRGGFHRPTESETKELETDEPDAA